MNRTPLRVALIGAGAIAQSHVQALRELTEGSLAAVVEPRVASGRAVAEAEGCAYFATVDECLDRTAVDAAVICAPPSLHAPLAEQLLDRGVHVLCEKPLALDSGSAARMYACAMRNRRVLAMASKFRYVADVVRARSLIAAGVLGEIVHYENVFSGRVDMSRRWNIVPEISGGGVLIDNGCHSVDLMRYLVGPISQILATEARRVAALPVEETVHIVARTAEGVLGELDLSWSVPRDVDHFVKIHGSRGVMSIGWKGSWYRLEGGTGPVALGAGYDKSAAFCALLRNFLAATRGEEELLISRADALASVGAVEAAYASMRSGRWIPIQATGATGAEHERAIPKRVA